MEAYLGYTARPYFRNKRHKQKQPRFKPSTKTQWMHRGYDAPGPEIRPVQAPASAFSSLLSFLLGTSCLVPHNKLLQARDGF